MPPQTLRKKSVKKLVERRMAKAIEEYEKTRADSINVGGSRSASTRGSANVQGCLYKTFMNCKPHSFNGTEGVVGLKCWFEKMEQVFEICKCIEDDKVKFAMSTEIQKMEQELWTLTLKGDDIEAYNNHFHELALTCSKLVPTERKKIEKTGHREKDCRFRVPGRNQQNEGARARAYVVVENPHQNPNVVAGTFLLNDHYACILFDSCAEKSFVSSAFTPFIDIAPTFLNTSYEAELVDGKVVSTDTVLRGCTLALYDHRFKIDLLPARLGSFYVIIGMDWLSYHRAVIDCYKKIVRIPLPNGEILEVQGERPEKDPGSLVCIKADEKKLDDI
nr:reverse transcriptase domain-containing protein [Tanacetum cinerariifolium]